MVESVSLIPNWKESTMTDEQPGQDEKQGGDAPTPNTTTERTTISQDHVESTTTVPPDSGQAPPESPSQSDSE